MLTDDAKIHFSKEWIFDTDDGAQQFDTEDEACAAQRAYRERLGFDPITGDAPMHPMNRYMLGRS